MIEQTRLFYFTEMNFPFDLINGNRKYLRVPLWTTDNSVIRSLTDTVKGIRNDRGIEPCTN